MFEFEGKRSSEKSWYYEGPEELVRIADALYTGSINTSEIDPYRQGVEITCHRHWTNGIVKIHAGENGHVLRRNGFGQDNLSINDDAKLGTSWFKDLDRFDPVAYVRSQISGAYITNLTFPIVINDANEPENSVYNGVIEPFAIRSVASFSSIFAGGIEPTGIKGHVVDGNVDWRQTSDCIDHVRQYDTAHKIGPFLDMIDMIGTTQTIAELDHTIPTIAPFIDAGNSREVTMKDVLLNASIDLRSAILDLEFDSENYVPTGSVSPTAGFTYDASIGTDSIAFGGMTY